MAITFYCTVSVIEGEITFGMMISTLFILGMLNGPLVQFIQFVTSAQYAKISFMKMNKIRLLEDEVHLLSIGSSTVLSDDKNLTLKCISFQYSPTQPFVLRNIYLHMPQNKVPAIVGTSGRGKSTLLKLLVSLYEPSYGGIAIGNTNLSSINLRWWRDMCGIVMQDGCIFSDTIKNNIVLSDEYISKNRLVECCRTSQILGDIKQTLKGFYTLIGEKGRGLSDGQKQRLLIARALYQSPHYLFLDEATNSLDVINEKR